jgi:hypothetical protein
MTIGTGWDAEIALADTTAVIALTGTDGQLDFTDGTNNLFRIDDTGSAATVSLPVSTSLFDLSAITHATTAVSGLLLPQSDLTTNGPSSGNGYLAFDTGDNQVKVWYGSAWNSIAGASTTLQQAYSNDVDGSDTLITLDATDGSLIVRPIAGTSFQVNQVTSAPTTTWSPLPILDLAQPPTTLTPFQPPSLQLLEQELTIPPSTPPLVMPQSTPLMS